MKSSVFFEANSKCFVILACTVLIQSQSVNDGQTNILFDDSWGAKHCMLSRVKNNIYFCITDFRQLWNNESATVSVGGTVEWRVAVPAVIAARQLPRLRRRVAVDRHLVILHTALRPDVRRQINVLAANHCSQSINHSFIHASSSLFKAA